MPRPKGSLNKATVQKLEVAHQTIETVLVELGLTREQLNSVSALDVMRICMQYGLTTGDLKTAFTAAVQLAPYEHPRLSNVDVKSRERTNIRDYTDAELLALSGEDESEEGTVSEDTRAITDDRVRPVYDA